MPITAEQCQDACELLVDRDHINGPGAWDANPWVVALTFTVHRKNVDAYLAQRQEAA